MTVGHGFIVDGCICLCVLASCMEVKAELLEAMERPDSSIAGGLEAAFVAWPSLLGAPCWKTPCPLWPLDVARKICFDLNIVQVPRLI